MRWHLIAKDKRRRLWSEKRYQDVLLLCNEMLERNPKDDLTWYYKGLANQSLNLLDEAIICFKQSEKLMTAVKWRWLHTDYSLWIFMQLSRVYEKKRNIDQALHYANKSVQADITKTEGLQWRASLREDLGDYLGASEDLNEALRRRPKDKAILELRDRMTYIIIEENRERASR